MADLRKKLVDKKTKLAQSQKNITVHPVLGEQFAKGTFLRIEIDQISPDADQPRKYFNPEALNELSKSIMQNGVLQPVLVRRDSNARIWLVAGERRYRAAKKAGLEVIPAILTTGDPVEIALIENIQRENLKPIEEAEALARLMDHHKYRQEDLARVIGKARSTVAETLSLNRLPERIKAECRRADNFPRRLLVEIAKQKTPEKMTSLFTKVKEQNINGTAIRKITRKKDEKHKKYTITETAVRRISSLKKHLNKITMTDLCALEQNILIQEMEQLIEVLHRMKNEVTGDCFTKIHPPPDLAKNS